MIYQHKKTGEKREFVPGMNIGSDWSPVHTMRHEKGVLTISEVDPKSITSIRAKKAAETRKKNKAEKKSAAKRKVSKK